MNNQMKANAASIATQLASGQWATVPNPYAQWMEEMVQKGINPLAFAFGYGNNLLHGISFQFGF